MSSPAVFPDPRNADIRIWVGDGLLPRADAKVSVFDSAVQGGDAVWEGLRVYDGGVFRLSAHLDRLFASARSLAFAGVPSRERVVAALAATLEANGMRDGAPRPPHADARREADQRHEPALEHRGLHAHRAGRVEAAGQRQRRDRPRPAADHRADPPQRPALPASRIHHANLLNNILAPPRGRGRPAPTTRSCSTSRASWPRRTR
jgi:branched-chain amino acid aminotransferase